MSWSVDSLTEHLLGFVSQDRNAAGGSVPDRATDIVRNELRAVWEAQDWVFRGKVDDLTVATNAATITLPDDYAKSVSGSARDVDHQQTLRFTGNVARWVRFDSRWRATEKRRPILANVVWDDSEESNWIANISPASDRSMTLPFAYLRRVPVDLDSGHADHRADDEVVAMPNKFSELWKLRATWRIFEAFQRDDREAIRGARADYRRELKAAIEQHNETTKQPMDVIAAAYFDRSMWLGDGVHIESSGVIQPIPSVRAPIMIPWHVHWIAVYDLDAGGPVAEAKAREILRAHLDVGVDGVRIVLRSSRPEVYDWIRPIFDSIPELRRVHVQGINSLYNNSSNPDMVHTSSLITDSPRLYCPSQRPTEYDTLMGFFSAAVARYDPHYVSIDQETWKAPGFHEHHQSGVINACTACGSEAKFVADWADIAAEFKSRLLAQRPNAHILFWNEYDHNNAGDVAGASPAQPIYAGYPSGSGAGHTPRLYHIHETAGKTAREVLEENFFNLISVEGGYPWICPGINAAARKTELLGETVFYDVCKTLAENGAHGFQLFPSPWSLEYTNTWGLLDSRHDDVMNLLRVGILAFKEVYGDAYRAEVA